jgi:hypothetical protein
MEEEKLKAIDACHTKGPVADSPQVIACEDKVSFFLSSISVN